MGIDEERIAFLMKKLSITREEAIELEGYDEDVKKNRKTQYDLTPEQIKNVQDMTRHCDHKKSGPRTIERKPNELKEAIVACLADFLENECEFTFPQGAKSLICNSLRKEPPKSKQNT